MYGSSKEASDMFSETGCVFDVDGEGVPAEMIVPNAKEYISDTIDDPEAIYDREIWDRPGFGWSFLPIRQGANLSPSGLRVRSAALRSKVLSLAKACSIFLAATRCSARSRSPFGLIAAAQLSAHHRRPATLTSEVLIQNPSCALGRA